MQSKKLYLNRRIIIPAFAALIMIALTAGPAAAQNFNAYHNYDDMTSMLRNAVDGHSDIARMEAIGKTLEGRSIWMIEIANRRGTPVEERPALFIGANFEGDHLIGSELSMFVIDYLLKNYASNPDVKERIDNHVFYVFPRVNPDGAELMFANIKTGRKTNSKEYDGDNDGRMDEDGPEDLNNDGIITVMRAKDPNGEYMIDPDEPRLMKKADIKKGESGEYKLYWEGIDNDKDGYINEDPKGGIDINRNFQHEYPYYKPDAGWHMVSELESRAIMDWMLEHKNVAIILTFGESDNLISAPNSRGVISSEKAIDLFKFADASLSGVERVGMVTTGGGGFGRFRGGGGGRFGQAATQPSGGRGRPSRNPETTVNSSDVEYFTTISKKYGELTKIGAQPMVRKPEGAFFGYGYYQFGVPSFSTPGWGIAAASQGRGSRGGMRSGDAPDAAAPARGGRGGQQARAMGMGGSGGQSGSEGIDKALLKWIDDNNTGGFVDWTTFNHPDLGEVEIGGFKPYAAVNPPANMIADLGASHAEFAVYLTSLFAEVKIAKTEVINHGGGLFRIKAEIVNNGFLPTAIAHGVVSRSVKPTMVQLGVDAKTIISGNSKTNFFQALGGSGKRQKYEWIIKGKSGQKIELKVVSGKGGTDKTTITLK